MTGLLRACLLALLLGGFASATNYTRGAWSFTLPDGAKESVQDGISAYGVGGAVYLFTPPEPLAGRTLEEVAAATMADITGGKTSGLKPSERRVRDDGTVLLPFSGTVTDPKTGQGNVQVYLFFAKEGQWGLALLMLGAGADEEAATEPLATVRFRPGSLPASQGGTETRLPRLPALPWSAPAPDRTVLTVPGVSFPAARKRGLDPEQDLLPDTFECYFAGPQPGDDLRAMTPTPDLRVAVAADGTYAANDGAARTPGRWTRLRDVNGRPSIRLQGPLVVDNTYVQATAGGQSFEATHAATRRGVLCYQAGPRAELLRLELTRTRIGAETLTCQDAAGGAPYPVTFGTGTYSTPRGGGSVRLGLSGSTYRDSWQGRAGFYGGPFDLHVGEMEEDGDGNRTLTVTQTIRESSLFYSGSTTTLLATCRSKVTPKPSPLYGRTPAPKTSAGGGPDGLYVSLQNHPRLIGNILSAWYELELSLFRPGGSHLADVNPTELGQIPDCGRTRPNGDPFCDRYELKNGQMRLQDGDGQWGKPGAYRVTPDGFTLGETRYVRVSPLTAAALAGVYSTEDFSGNGPPGGTLGGGVGVYNSLSSGYLFTPDGGFQWKYSSSSSTLISPSLITGGGAVGGGGSTRTDGGQGTYTLKDNWLTLKFADGRVQRLYVYPQPAFFLKEDPSRGQQLNVGGTWLHRAPGK